MCPPEASVDDATAHLAVELKTAVMRLNRRLRGARGDNEISHGQFTVLSIVANRGPQTLGQLSQLERVTPPSMNRTVNCLVAAGLVERESSPDDGRIVLVRVTTAGEGLVREAQQQRNAWLSARLTELDAEQRAVLAEATGILKGIAIQ